MTPQATHISGNFPTVLPDGAKVLVVHTCPIRFYKAFKDHQRVIFWAAKDVDRKSALPTNVAGVFFGEGVSPMVMKRVKAMASCGPVNFAKPGFWVAHDPMPNAQLQSRLRQLLEVPELNEKNQDRPVPAHPKAVAEFIENNIDLERDENEERARLFLEAQDACMVCSEEDFGVIFKQVRGRLLRDRIMYTVPSNFAVTTVVGETEELTTIGVPSQMLGPTDPASQKPGPKPLDEPPAPVVQGGKAVKIVPPPEGLFGLGMPLWSCGQPIMSPVPRLLFPTEIGGFSEQFIPSEDEISEAVKLLLKEAEEHEAAARKHLKAARLKRHMAALHAKG